MSGLAGSMLQVHLFLPCLQMTCVLCSTPYWHAEYHKGGCRGGGGWTGEEQEKREKKCQWTGWKVGVGRGNVKLEKVREKLNS